MMFQPVSRRWLLLCLASWLFGLLPLAGRDSAGAEPAEGTAAELRVLTYNIHHGEGVDGRLDLERIAAVIRSVEPHIVALQEVDKNVPRSGSVDQPAELARLTGMQSVFFPSIPLNGGEYGNALLTRFPVRESKRHLLPRHNDGEQRTVLEVELEMEGELPKLLVFATHLDHRPNESERLASADMLNQLARSRETLPMILAGDLNAVPQSETLRRLRSEWTLGNDEPLPTFPVDTPRRQIDYILVRPAQHWRVLECRVLDERVASDHRPLFLRVAYQGD